MSAAERDLVTSEGVDEGSADSAVEGPSTGAGADDGAATDPSSSTGPPPEPAPATPDDMESDASRAARDARGPGQQLEAGEG